MTDRGCRDVALVAPWLCGERLQRALLALTTTRHNSRDVDELICY
jgi:hypothetical protein